MTWWQKWVAVSSWLKYFEILFLYYFSVIYNYFCVFYLFTCITLHEWGYRVDLKTRFLFQFLSLASSILNFITTSMLKSRNNFIRNYLSVSLTEQHMATLASIIKDVDKDVKGFFFLKLLTLISYISHTFRLFLTCKLFCPGSSDEEFASALYHFNHSLVTSDLPSPSLQVNSEICFKRNLNINLTDF